jgi:pyruvate formate lyase activating enzyme
MKIKHIEKFTLIDYPKKISCTIFLFGCNFRCGFCHNPELVLKEETKDIAEEKILEFLKSRKGKLEGVCFTGGEPLMTLGVDFLKKIKSLGYKIKIDTNGGFPEKLKKIIDKEIVDYIAMDIKGQKEDYNKITGINVNLNDIEKSIKIISQLPAYEFRTTILKRYHDKENIEKMFEWLDSLINKKIKNFSFQAFQNNGKFIDKNNFQKEPSVPEGYINELKPIAEKYCKKVNIK